MTEEEKPSGECLFPSFAHSVGFALGELLLLMGMPEDLTECLHAIEVTAKATIMSAPLEGGERERRSALPRAALAVVAAWRNGKGEVNALADAVCILEETLERVGIRYPTPHKETSSL